MGRINDILYNLSGTSAYRNLRSKLALEHQDIQSIKILRTEMFSLNLRADFCVTKQRTHF
jgi:hypothetical protein